MLAAGLVAKKAVERGLRVKPWVKTSLTPGSTVVSKYLEAAGLQPYLDKLGFAIAGYSCGTCVGASGPIDAELEKSIMDKDTVACAVLSGNRNFEARIHPAVRAAFLASPPLVVAFALAGRVDVDLDESRWATTSAAKRCTCGTSGRARRSCRPRWISQRIPSSIARRIPPTSQAKNPLWRGIAQATGEMYPWESDSSYIKEPPFLEESLRTSTLRDITGARALAILGNSITTDHISPIGSIKATSPAGTYLQKLGVAPVDFNNYGARRMNHEVMMRGTFANVRLKNLMVPGVEGGVTVHQPSGERTSIYDAAMRYVSEHVPLIVVAGEEYGTGSARDWAAKGVRLLGVRAVVANSFERIHRSNLVGMGVLPCQLPAGTTAATLELDGSETFDLLGLDDAAKPGQPLMLVIHRAHGSTEKVPITLRLDTPAEIDYVRHGGIMPYVLAEITKGGDAGSGLTGSSFTSTKERLMDKKLMDAGLKVRREVLGAEYVDRAMKNADDFNKPFQEVVSEYCWGLCWTDETLSRRERSILNLGMIAALGKMHEFELHFRAARRNGLTNDELRAVLTQIAVYCGIPVGVDCFRTAKQVLSEQKAS